MSDVQFNPGEMDYGGGGMGRPTQQGGFLVRLTMKLTGIQDETQVNKILLGVAILFFVASAIIFFVYL